MKKLIALSSLALLALTIGSCSLDDEPIGANITPATEDFQILSDVVVSNKDVNFSIDSVTLQASFNEQVSYIATFIGLESGATRTIKGLAKDLTSSSLTWNGEHDGMLFFRDGEDVKVELSFVGTDITTVDTLNIVSGNQFKSTASYNFSEAGFENLDASNAYANGWFIGNDDNTATLTRIAVTDPVPPQGVKSFKISGSNPSGVYITGIDNSLTGKNKFFELPANGDDVWFNIFVYGNGNPYTELIIEFREADAAGLETPYEKVKAGETDGIQAFIYTDHEGWKLFSFQYSTLPFSNFTAGGGNGNKVHESDRIQQMIFNLQSVEGNNGAFVEAIFDYPIFTIGGPFDPTIHKSKP